MNARSTNYFKALSQLEREVLAHPLESCSDLEKAGLAQLFELTFELAWKALRGHLEESGLALPQITPRSVIRGAWTAGLIENGETWMDMLGHRNLLSHTYDQAVLDAVLRALAQDYLQCLLHLSDLLRSSDGDA